MFEKLGTFLTGYRTYILGGVGAVFNIAAQFNWIPASIDQASVVGFVNTVLGFLIAITLRSAVSNPTA